MSRERLAADKERRLGMDEDSKRREFLRQASLAGVALVAGGGLLTVAGCDGDELKKTKAELEQCKADLASATHATGTPQVDIDSKGNLLILDEALKSRLWEIWEAQASKPTFPDPDPPDPPTAPHPRKGFHVRFTISIPSGTGTPEDHKVNSLCAC